MSAPARPPPPIVGKVTHHNIELYWEEALAQANLNMGKGDSRMRITVQEEDKHGCWGNVYTGYGKRHIFEGLEPWTGYRYRLRFMNEHGCSEWSPSIQVSTTKEPLTGEHVHRAIMLQDISTLERVLDSGDVKPDIPDKYGFTPLMQASQKGYIDLIEVLINHGADANYQNDAGKTCLMLAAYAGKLQAVKELRYHKARYDMRDKGGSTPMHWAMDGGNTELIEWMLDDGAEINAQDYNGWTPLLRVAAVTGNRDVAHTVVRGGANINAKDKDGKTALMIAVVNGHQSLVELLLERDADLTVKNEYGKTAYDMALSMDRRNKEDKFEQPEVKRVIRSLEEHMDKKGIKRF